MLKVIIRNFPDFFSSIQPEEQDDLERLQADLNLTTSKSIELQQVDKTLDDLMPRSNITARKRYKNDRKRPSLGRSVTIHRKTVK
jgi:hypothetical protein